MVKITTSGQISFIGSYREEDRNFSQGGRSFYFFDVDDNIFHLDSKIVVTNKESGHEMEVSTVDFSKVGPLLEVKGSEWEHYCLVDPSGNTGAFRSFRDQPGVDVDQQSFIKDFAAALANPFIEWRGPSWDFFVHAVNNNRPIALITARGHHPNTIKRAFNLLVSSRILEACPNYLSVFPLSNPETRRYLGDPDFKLSIHEMKKLAIKACTKDAFDCFGKNPSHRFGMSDDDPQNIELISEAMIELKTEYPDNAFFVINTHNRGLKKQEIGVSVIPQSPEYSNEINTLRQLHLF